MACTVRWAVGTCIILLLLTSCLLYVTLLPLRTLPHMVPVFLVPPNIIKIADPRELVHKEYLIHTKLYTEIPRKSNLTSTDDVNRIESPIESVSTLVGNLSQLGSSHMTRSGHMTKVLLMTYYRGGSSFLGQIFAQNHHVFYWFEPLDSSALTMKSEFGKIDGIKLVESDYQLLPNGSIGQLPDGMINGRTLTMARTLSCNATLLDKKTLSGQFFRTGQGMPRFGPYLKCLHDRTVKNKNEICPRILQSTCFNSTITAAKVIRYPMYEVPKLLEYIPDLKIIHYIRDPRGIISSRAKIHGWSGSRITTNSRNLCTKMAKNHKIFNELQNINPDNFLLLKYEDLALEPESTARRIYKFLGHSYPDYMRSWIEKNTAAKSRDWTYGTRRDSKKTVYGWKKQFMGKDYRTATEQCQTVLKMFGYQP